VAHTRQVERSAAVDGFRLAYERAGSGPAVVLLHGWPGDHTDYRDVVPLLSPTRDVIAPDLRGFGGSDKHLTQQYGADAQARSVIGLIEELGLDRPVLGGYDIGSRIAQTVARQRPDLVRAMVVSPPLPGIGQRILAPEVQRQFWYQSFHQLKLAEELIDGDARAVRAYLKHFWSDWSGPDFTPTDERLDQLTASYAEPGAFTASIGWYRAGAGAVARSLAEQVPLPEDRIAVPTTVLWPEHDPLFTRDWADRVEEFFADIRVTFVDGIGHYVPVEAPAEFAARVTEAGTMSGGGQRAQTG
jgi:pimeloyl-ACP methyl ester carboxylesterase